MPTEKTPLRLYNSLTHKIDPFESIGKTIGIYTCGPTVYNYAHIGNLRTYVFEDILKRVLEYNGYKVKHVMNITDVGHLTSDADTGEDKMEKGAAREGKTAWDVAQFYTEAFFHDLKELNIIPADKFPRATDHIKEQIKLVEVLEKKGFTYKTSDGVYFDTSKLPDYGKLANLKNQSLKAGARVELGEKKNPTDFALWKFSTANEKRQMEWKSPWGVGFPGWHLECSAMAVKYLGQPFDIHCGGIDHIPVHHTNEIAQSEAAFGKPLANYWMHGEFLLIDLIKCVRCGNYYKPGLQAKVGVQPINQPEKANLDHASVCPNCGETNFAKMAKSGENFLTLQKLITKIVAFLENYGYELKKPALVYRFFLLGTHYRKQINYSDLATQGSTAGYLNLILRINNLLKNIEAPLTSPSNKGVNEIEKEFKEYINDDLNTPEALRVLIELIKTKNPKISNKEKINAIKNLDAVLGLDLINQAKSLDRIAVPTEIQKLVFVRDEARKNKDWTKSDALRKQLEDMGYEVEDSKEGTKVKKK